MRTATGSSHPHFTLHEPLTLSYCKNITLSLHRLEFSTFAQSEYIQSPLLPLTFAPRACDLSIPVRVANDGLVDELAEWRSGSVKNRFWRRSQPHQVLSGDYRCCKASWASSVYTPSFPGHELPWKRSPRCRLRCLSRENKLNLSRQDGDKTEDGLLIITMCSISIPGAMLTSIVWS